MDVKEVKKIIRDIKKVSRDDEVCHSKEDNLYIQVLISISKDPSNAQELAKETLKTQKIKFSRWAG